VVLGEEKTLQMMRREEIIAQRRSGELLRGSSINLNACVNSVTD